MALKVDYFVKETGRNLFRNPWLTIATVVTVFVAILLVGVSLLVRSGVQNATARWQGGIEFIVFMNPEATPDQIDSVARDLSENPQVETAEFKDKDQSYAEFLELFADTPEFTANITPDVLPTSFNVKPSRVDPELIEGLVLQFAEKPGVREVVAASQAIREIKSLSDGLSTGILAAALLLTLAAVVLIGNTIQTAIFARRREIEVMKLVGATNWFIRVPFMLEGILQGVVGAIAGIGGVYVVNGIVERRVQQADALSLLSSFVIKSEDVFTISIFLLGGGVLMAAIASAIAVTFYVKV
ncbi:MAG: ABC transporter permease [Actinomycetota bacterium]|nr:ABC transporter permease [Acidimicrobiia bacterium]MDQ3294164.1 ABC transporter permease [Actinomycetota bacterium]